MKASHVVRRTVQNAVRSRKSSFPTSGRSCELLQHRVLREQSRDCRAWPRIWNTGAQMASIARSKKRCAAQAEYGRLAAQAYSPSDAMSQAGICLDGIQKVQRRSRRTWQAQVRSLKRGLAARVAVGRAGWSSRLFPAVRGLAACPPCGRAVRRVAWPRRPPGIAPFSPCRRSALFRARPVRLARRDQPSGRRDGPHRLRQPCRLRRPIEPREPSGQIGVTPPQRLQQGRLGGIGEFLLHDGKT